MMQFMFARHKTILIRAGLLAALCALPTLGFATQAPAGNTAPAPTLAMQAHP